MVSFCSAYPGQRKSPKWIFFPLHQFHTLYMQVIEKRPPAGGFQYGIGLLEMQVQTEVE